MKLPYVLLLTACAAFAQNATINGVPNYNITLAAHADTGAVNAMTVSAPGVVLGSSPWSICVTPNHTNTGATTLALNGGTAYPVYSGGAALVGGELPIGTGATGQGCKSLTWNNGQTRWDMAKSGGAPSGAAGGVLSGTYPNPGMATGAAVTNIGFTPLNPANNLSEVTAATARTNLGLGTAATQASAAFEVPLTFGSGLNRASNTITIPALGVAASMLPNSGAQTGDVSGTFPATLVKQTHETRTSVNFAASPYAVVAADTYINCDASGGAVVINLPASTGAGRDLTVKKTDSSANACTLTRAGSDLIDGAATVPLTSQYVAAKVKDRVTGTWDRTHINQLGGDVTGPSNATVVTKLNGTSLAGLATGLIKNTTGTGVPSIAVAGTDFAAATNGTNGQALTSNAAGGFGTPVTLPAFPAGTIVGTSDTQALTNKTVDGVAPATLAFMDATSSVQTQINGKQASLGFTPVTNARNVNTSAPLTGGGALSGDLTLALSMWGSGSMPAAAVGLGTAGNCAQWSAAGIGDAGAPCGTGGGVSSCPGCAGNGVTDDTAAMQTALNGVCDNTQSPPSGSIFTLPVGIFKISNTLAITNCQGFGFRGQGDRTRILWAGTSAKPWLLATNIRDPVYEKFEVLGTAANPLQSGIYSQNALSPNYFNLSTYANNALVTYLNGSAPAWSSGTAYVAGTQVTQSGSYYVSIAPGTNHDPVTATTYWVKIPVNGAAYKSLAGANTNHQPDTTPASWVGPLAWSSGTTYALGQEAVSGGVLYLSLQSSNTNNTPGAVSPFWGSISSASIVDPGNAKFEDIHFQGQNGYITNPIVVGAGLNANNDLSLFIHNRFDIYKGCGVVIASTQSLAHSFFANEFYGGLVGQAAICGQSDGTLAGTYGSAGNFYIDGGLFGTNNYADVLIGGGASGIGGPQQDVTIRNATSEGSHSGVKTDGPSSAMLGLKLDNYKFDTANLNADGIAISFLYSGSLEITNSMHLGGDGGDTAFKIDWNPLAGGPGSFTIRNSQVISNTSTTIASIFPHRIPTLIENFNNNTGSNHGQTINSLNGILFSQLPAWTGLPNGLHYYVTDANSNCTAGSLSGRNCYREGGAWTNSGNPSTISNCASSASPAVCGSSAAGSIVIGAAATTVVVNTSAVTPNSQIQITPDVSLGTRLGVTCNTTIPMLAITARTPATSFTVTATAAPVTDPLCLSYSVLN